MAAVIPIYEIFGELLGLAVGDLAIIFACVTIALGAIAWRGNVPASALLVIAVPAFGMLIGLQSDGFAMMMYTIILVMIGFALWWMFQEVTKKN
jgi:hypothetical protein